MPGQIGWVHYHRTGGALIPVKTYTEAVPTERSQPQCEMLAVKSLVLHLHGERQAGRRGECSDCGHLPMVVVAVDADAVRFCLRKGYSGDPKFRAAIRATLGCEVWCYRIPGVLNAADAPSGGKASTVDELLPEPNRASVGALESGFAETRMHYCADVYCRCAARISVHKATGNRRTARRSCALSPTSSWETSEPWTTCTSVGG